MRNEKKLQKFEYSMSLIILGNFTIFSGTSNWAKDYYTRTAGIGIAFESVEDEFGRLPESDLRIELLNVFNRDWNSPHCKKMK